MSRRRTLQSLFSWWFAGSLLVLYASTAVMIWLYAASTARQYAVLTLKVEAEEIAGEVEKTGRFDAPEFDAPEEGPIPIWIRAVREGRIVAKTPGTPDLAVVAPPEGDTEVFSVSFPSGREPYVLVRHRAGDVSQRSAVEAIGSLAPLIRRERVLGAGLAIVGLVVLPLAALGGRLLARRALRPITGLVRAIRAVDSHRFEERVRLPEGSVSEVALLARAFNDLLGRLEASVATMRRFTADASHEIRNPLSVLRSGIDVALRRERTAAEYRQILVENLQEIERLQAIVEGLLAMARDVPGREYPLAIAPVDLSSLVGETLRGFAVIASERNVPIEATIAPGIAVEGDERLLRLVAFNLVDNALKHGPQGEPVRVALYPDGEGARLVVADDGPGVAPENRTRVFERFFRADTASQGGTGGLGLSVVRWVADLHGGSVRLLEAERGAAFEVTLPPAPPLPSRPVSGESAP